LSDNIIATGKPGENLILNNIHNRLMHKNKNWLCVICGPTGSAKSYSGMRLGEMINPERFDIDRIVFNAEDFMKLLNSGTLNKGDVIMFDEAGVGLPAREFASLTNKMFNYVLQTFRYRNIGVIFTIPSFSFLDIQARKLLHSYVETVSINREKNHAIVKFLDINVNPRIKDKIYFQYPRIRLPNGRVYTIQQCHIRLPTAALQEQYEVKKAQFAETLNKAVLTEIQHTKSKEEEKPLDLKQLAVEVYKDPQYCLLVGKQGKKTWDATMIKHRFGIHYIDGLTIRRLLNTLPEFAELPHSPQKVTINPEFAELPHNPQKVTINLLKDGKNRLKKDNVYVD
jgi:hypothetical protein